MKCQGSCELPCVLHDLAASAAKIHDCARLGMLTTCSHCGKVVTSQKKTVKYFAYGTSFSHGLHRSTTFRTLDVPP